MCKSMEEYTRRIEAAINMFSYILKCMRDLISSHKYEEISVGYLAAYHWVEYYKSAVKCSLETALFNTGIKEIEYKYGQRLSKEEINIKEIYIDIM